MGLRYGGGGQAQGGDAGAGAGAGGQVAGHGEGLGGERGEPDLAAPAGEDAPLGIVGPAGVAGEDRLQGCGHALIGGAQLGERRGARGGRSGCRQRWSWTGLRRQDFGMIWTGERCAISVIIARRMKVRKTGAEQRFHRRLPDHGGPEYHSSRGSAFPHSRGGRPDPAA